MCVAAKLKCPVLKQKWPEDEMKEELYRNNLKNREFCEEAPQNFQAKAMRSERPLPNWQGASEHENYEDMPTMQKTDSSGCFGINMTYPRMEA